MDRSLDLTDKDALIRDSKPVMGYFVRKYWSKRYMQYFDREDLEQEAYYHFIKAIDAARKKGKVSKFGLPLVCANSVVSALFSLVPGLKSLSGKGQKRVNQRRVDCQFPISTENVLRSEDGELTEAAKGSGKLHHRWSSSSSISTFANVCNKEALERIYSMFPTNGIYLNPYKAGAVLDSLDRLRPSTLELRVILLRYFGTTTYKEIAVELGVSHNKVKAVLSKYNFGCFGVNVSLSRMKMAETRRQKYKAKKIAKT